MKDIKIVQIGMGPLGQKITKYILERNGLKIVGAVDKDPLKIGRDLGEICGIKKTKIFISSSLKEIVKKVKPDVVLLTTVSSMEKITPQIEEIIAHKIPVVSTCEELSYPWKTSPSLSKIIDVMCKKNKVAVVGTGVNPGFLMDSFPVFLTAVCQKVNKICISRIQDATFRRIPFQNKIGSGLTLKEFSEKKKAGTLRHVGLTESIQMIAGRMGWKLTRTEDVLSPIISKKKIVIPSRTILPGMAAGVQQIGRGFIAGKEKIRLIFRAAVGEPNPADTVKISGEPDIISTIKGGVNGDIATCAITINAIKQIIRSTPGLKTMLDIPPVSYFE